MTTMDRVVVVGGGGHGKVVGEIVELSSSYELAGWVDRGVVGEQINGGVILGNDDDLEAIYQSGVKCAVVGVGSVGDVSIRKKLAKFLTDIGYELISLKHPAAVISSRVKMDRGTCVMAGAVIQTNVTIGEQCIVNSRAVIEHDCSIGSFVHVSPGAVLAGGVKVDDESHIGMGALIKEGVKIGKGSLVAAGAVVLRDVGDGMRVAGCPAKNI